MITDSSAIVAYLLREKGHERLAKHFEREPAIGVGTPTLTETGIVLAAQLGAAGKTLLARFQQEVGLLVIPFGPEHYDVAVDAFLRFGKGRNPARLNFGDCLTYATAWLSGEPLLCIGNDFAKTDLELVPLE